ncbi:putative peroxisomal acyl-coenzyme A oxidase 1.2 isoform X3 [Apium graveolens]|uniref:putative peroxisomal acyl-coenzyme A oxidase 1.2 isoform X3 n=1 Tax=Apium graveolens TaxID=4045 RepID=UPI003D7A30CA
MLNNVERSWVYSIYVRKIFGALLVLKEVGVARLGQGMFVPAIKGQGTEEQQEKWLPLAQKMQIIGCYAQTERLETTATFDSKTDEFVIHSPTLTSSKVSILIYKTCLIYETRSGLQSMPILVCPGLGWFLCNGPSYASYGKW